MAERGNEPERFTSKESQIADVPVSVQIQHQSPDIPHVVLGSSNKDKTGNVEFEEYAHVEHKDEISPELEELLHTDPKYGLTTGEAISRLNKFGRNMLEEKKTNPFLKFLSFFTGSIAYLIEVAFILSIVAKDWVSCGIILGLLIVNAVIGFVEEYRAESALDALKQNLALKTRVWRDGALTELNATELVPGDIIALRLGDVIPADSRLLGIGVNQEPTEGDLLVDQSALTGESLPVTKNKDSIVYSSSVIKQGQQMAVVIKTGSNTFIGRAANLISITKEEGHFQKIINKIGNFLMIISIMMVVILLAYHLAITRARNPLNSIQMVLILAVAAIPIGLPTVMSVTMAFGAKQLARKKVIVRRLTSIEEMASVSVLCSDKTGTLTLNELTFDEPYLCPGFTPDDILLYSFLAAEPGTNDPIESAVCRAAETNLQALKSSKIRHQIPGYKITSFLPFDPIIKMTRATVINTETNMVFKVAKGAPQVIIKLVGGNDEAVRAVNSFARRGLRALGVARTVPGDLERYELIGMISFLDPPQPDSVATIAECARLGVDIKMITGDQLIIAKEVAQRLGMQRVILDANHLVEPSKTEEFVTNQCVRADGFAQVIPEHKYRVVELLQKKGFLVGMTGDGVNDAPALKKANVGIAVHGCTDAARSAADIVLLAPGLSTIVDGIKTSRAIFQRMRSYALYRITSTIHFLIFFFLITLIEVWNMPPILLILITVLNDAATIVIAWDNTQISSRPDKWRLGQLVFLSTVLAFCLSAMSFVHFYIARDIFHVTDKQLHTIMYLHISSCPHFVIFSTRIPGYVWQNRPSLIFTVVILATQIIAMLVSIYGVTGHEHLIEPIGWIWGISIMAISLAYMFVLDFVKVLIFRWWNFEKTVLLWPSPARRRKLSQKKLEVEHRKYIKQLKSRVRKSIPIAVALQALRDVEESGIASSAKHGKSMM
ncbi:uncharacterized protein VTP21DRAFT_3931 [Calcarisporiella thermophila]|uniref:uncharacterized protein n=1 Tax=Calcarisporiella thermophila TaxID=911321 RepID=UPI003743304B